MGSKKGRGLMFPAARITDSFSDGDAIAIGSGNVFINGLPAAKFASLTTGEGCFPPTVITSGSGSVFINGIPAVRLTDSKQLHCCPGVSCHGGSVSTGSGNVFFG